MNPNAPGQQPVAEAPAPTGTPPPIVGRDVFPVQQHASSASATSSVSVTPQNSEDITSDLDVSSLSPVSASTEQAAAQAPPSQSVQPAQPTVASPVPTGLQAASAPAHSQAPKEETSKPEHTPHLEFSKIVPEDPKKSSGGGNGLMIFGLVLVLIGGAIIVAGFAGVLPKM